MKRKWFYRLATFALPVLVVLSMPLFPILSLPKGEPVDVMDMSLEDLLKVEITTAGKKPEKVIDIPASVVFVTRGDIEKYGCQTLAEVLENIPGLYQTDDYAAQNFGVRGFWTLIPQRNFIILVNGVNQSDGLTSGCMLQHINLPVEAIDRIEVVRGPMSVMYGTGAFFGVINIKTDMVGAYRPLKLFSVSVGPGNTHKLFTRVSGKEKGFQYSFNASYFHTGGLDVPYEEIGDPVTLARWGIKPGDRTAGQLQNSEKYFNFSGRFDGFSFDSSFTEADRGMITLFPSLSDGSIQNTRSLRVAFGYKKDFSYKAKLDARFCYFVNSAGYDYKMLYPDFLGVQDDGARAYNAELNLFLYPSSRLDITVGCNYRKILQIKNDLTVPALGVTLWGLALGKGESGITRSLFTQVDYKFSSRLKIVAGFRLEQTPPYTMQFKKGHIDTGDYSILLTRYSYTGMQYIPRLAFIYNLDSRNVFKLLYGKAVNQPSFFQMAEEGYFPPVELPKPEPETIHTLELNYVGQYSRPWWVSASIFRNMLDRLIYRTMTVIDGRYISYYDNVGKMNTTGVEVTVQTTPGDNFSVELSAVYQYTVDMRYKNIEPGYSPRVLGYLKAFYSFNRNITLAVTGNYVGPMASYYDDTLKPPDRLGRKVPGYFLLGANLRIKDLFMKDVFLNIRGSNLLDQRVYYPTTSNNYLFAKKGTIGRGISLLVTLGWRL